MCKGTTAGDGIAIYEKAFHDSTKHHCTKESIYVDECIADEVASLLSNGVATLGHSCCGHGKEQAQVWIFPEYEAKAHSMGYETFKAYTMCGIENIAIKLKTGTQSSVLQFEGNMHED